MSASSLPLIFAWLAAASSGLSTALITWLWLKEASPARPGLRRVVLAGGSLTVLAVAGSLLMQVLAVSHWPPGNTGQSFLLWGGLVAGLGLLWHRWPAASSSMTASTSFGWAGASVLLLLGAILFEPASESVQAEALWLWAGLARGLTLLGLAGLMWLFSLEVAHNLKLFWPEDRWPKQRAHFQHPVNGLQRVGLGWVSTAALLLGLSLLILRVWWGWGQVLNRVAWPSVIISLVLARSWLMLHRPHSARLLLIFTGLSLLGGVPLIWALASL